MSELIIIGYDDHATAEKAYERVLQLHRLQQRLLVRDVVVDRHRIDVQRRSEPPHAERIDTVGIDERERRGADPLRAERHARRRYVSGAPRRTAPAPRSARFGHAPILPPGRPMPLNIGRTNPTL